jgi:ABC-type nitrate/sulfonate/bicarbonate transport system ATPase subunit
MIVGVTNGPVVLEAKHVSLRLGGAEVLNNVSFSIVDRVRAEKTTGQVVSILGGSGAGKTRLLRVLAGLDAPDAGIVSGIDGKPLELGAVGMVFQDYPLLRHRTVAENLELAGAIGGLSAKDTRARTKTLLELVGLTDRAGFYPCTLSGGQRQRAAIAQQLVVPRRLLLLDEPFSGLDPLAIEEVSKLVVDVANLHELNTVVLVTHDIRAALAVSDTVFLLGKTTRDGGATVLAKWDLVELDVAWGVAEGTPRLAALERELKSSFRRV